MSPPAEVRERFAADDWMGITLAWSRLKKSKDGIIDVRWDRTMREMPFARSLMTYNAKCWC